MTKIISDTSTLYTPEQAKEVGLYLAPLCVNISGQNYREFVDIDDNKLLSLIKEGGIPKTSQPPVGEKIDLYNSLGKDDDVIDITIADGLSGAYNSALSAKESCECPEKITVFNSKTLCGPHRYVVDEALKMAKEGASKDEILAMLEKSVATELSMLVPVDFSFLKRGGRISKAAASLGGLLKLHICVIKTDDGKMIEKHSISRTLKGNVNSMMQELTKRGYDNSYLFTVAHAQNPELAEAIKAGIEKTFPGANIDVVALSPAFITQGGPGCCALQVIKLAH